MMTRKKRFYKSELTVVDSSNKGKSLLGIVISTVVLLIISTMIVAAIVIINPDIGNIPGRQHLNREAITLEESILNELSARDIEFRWMSTPNDLLDQLLWEDNRNIQLATLPSSEHRNSLLTNITKTTTTTLQITTGTKQSFKPDLTTLVSNSSLLSSIEFQGYKLSPSRRYLLIWTMRRKQFRHSFTAKYFLYDIHLDLISLLSTNKYQRSQTSNTRAGNVESDTQQKSTAGRYEQLDSASIYLNDQIDSTSDESNRFQVVDWFSSDSLLMIQNNDIYILGNVAEDPSRLTWSGKKNELFNGIPDWLYEEEILADTPAFQVSPSGSRLAYMSFNDSQVLNMPFSVYGEQTIPRIQSIKYPKTGTPNPTVSVHIIENLVPSPATGERNQIELLVPDDLATQQHYINRINWLTDQRLAMTWSNRHQNESHILICSKVNSWKCEKNLHLSAAGGWLDISDDLYALDEEYYLTLMPKFEGDDVGNFKHLARVSLTKANTFNYITGGRKDVLGINGVDIKRSLVYYTSTVADEPGQRQLYVAELESTTSRAADKQQSVQVNTIDSQEPPSASVCVTCDHYPSECLYNIVKMSPSTNYYVFYCEGPGVPRIELRATRRRRHRLSGHVGAAIGGLRTRKLADEGYVSSGDEILDAPLAGDEENSNTGQENLLWTIEDNRDLREKLEHGKAMPLTMRLKVPIANTNYSANVLLLLPPQLGPTTVFKSSLSASLSTTPALPPHPSSSSSSSSPLSVSSSAPRPRRGAVASGLLSSRTANEDRPLHSFYTSETIGDYYNQLNSGQRFPMVVDVYAGPGSQKVDYRFSVYFGHYLASSRRTVYAAIDGRGSGYQGTKRLFEMYHKFGTVEIQDQIDVAAHLAKTMPFIDASRVAIWGWSYGGYAAAMALAQSNAQAYQQLQMQVQSMRPSQSMNITTPAATPQLTTGNPLSQTIISSLGTKSMVGNSVSTTTAATQPPEPQPSASLEPITGLRHLMRLATAAAAPPPSTQTLPSPPSLRGVFECAVSVAPVTNWIYYDTAYTEKYMSSPWANEHYDQSVIGDHFSANKNTSSASTANATGDGNIDRRRSPLLARPLTITTANRWSPVNQSIDSIAATSQTLPLNLIRAHKKNKNSVPPNQWMDLNERYKRASLLEQIPNIDGKRFLLIHGTADDNVHFQQSVMLMKRLIQSNTLFETRLYPDQDHSIANKADKLHLGSTLSSFFAECFDMAY